jgi:hypothetical protein
MGYAEDLLDPSQQHITDEFLCPICQEVAKAPQCCSKCFKAFCGDCIKFWQEKSDICPFKCRKEKMGLIDLPDSSVMTYYSINLRCTKNCGQFVNILDYSEHLATCALPSCSNTADCTKKIKFHHKGMDLCSYTCYLSLKFQRRGGALTPSDRSRLDAVKTTFAKSFYYQWDRKASSQAFQCKEKNFARISSNGANFHTLVCKTGICGGVTTLKFTLGPAQFHYKLGITSKKDFETDKAAFCDFLFGYAMSAWGQTRHAMEDAGMFYGEALDLTKETVIEMELNMGHGELKFVVDGKPLGPAFDCKALTEGVWYPAIAVAGNMEKILIEKSE